MQEPGGLKISSHAFVQAMGILLVLMLLAGALTLTVPAGSYVRTELDGRQIVQAGSYQEQPRPDYPAWRWLIAPLEVLASSDGLIIIVIIIFLLMIGISFSILESTGILRTAVNQIVQRFAGQKYLLLCIVAFFFMLLGAFFGIFEEVVPLVPIMVILSYSLGWDALVGLGMSILATNVGFSTAITNPFTIGVAQQMAGLPLFSGSLFRLPVFLVMYAVLAFFLVFYARRIERAPWLSPIYKEDAPVRQRARQAASAAQAANNPHFGRSMRWLAVFLGLIMLSLLAAPFVPALSDYSLPLVGLLFFIGGLGAGALSGAGFKKLFASILQGIWGIAPAIPLILMAASVKHIIASGGILDTLLYRSASVFAGSSAFNAALLIFILALFLDVFVSSGSAKAFLLMPLLLPLSDLVGVTRQVAVTAYCFGDGFTNMAYPTSATLLIALGLASVSYSKWMKWTLPLWVVIGVLAVAALAVGVAINLGPF